MKPSDLLDLDGVSCRSQPKQIGMIAVRHFAARRTIPAAVCRRDLLAIDQFGEFPGQGRLADPGHPAEEQGMGDAVGFHQLPEKPLGTLLSWKVSKCHDASRNR
jgi:hypothetical protein